MYKKAWCTCKVLVLPIQALTSVSTVTFFDPPPMNSRIVGKRRGKRMRWKTVTNTFTHVIFQLPRPPKSPQQVKILDRIKWRRNSPFPENRGWSRVKAKTHHFPILFFGGGRGLSSPFVLSKIYGYQTRHWWIQKTIYFDTLKHQKNASVMRR